jgi:hypothetical protein
MGTPAIFCPQCGAPAPFRGTTLSLVCEYCGSTIARTGADVELVGKVSALVDTGSPILLGSRGTWGTLPFEVVGRLQVTYARGTWNEWALEFSDGTEGWLSDAQGAYAVMRANASASTGAPRLPPFDLELGDRPYELGGRRLVAVDRRVASYRGAEGALPFDARPGLCFHAVDLRGFDGEFCTLDYGTDPRSTPTVWFGAATDPVELRLHPLRTFEGWRAPA